MILQSGSRFLAVSLAATFLFGCASTRVDFGGVMNEQAVPAGAVSCDDYEWRDVERVPPDVPMDLVRLWFFRQDKSASNLFEFAYDVDRSGSTANIRFTGPEAYTRHTTMRKAILASAEAIEQWRFEAAGEPEYVTGCEAKMSFEYQVQSRP